MLSYAKELSSLEVVDGAVGGCPQDVEEGRLELEVELEWVAGGWGALKRVENGLECEALVVLKL